MGLWGQFCEPKLTPTDTTMEVAFVKHDLRKISAFGEDGIGANRPELQCQMHVENHALVGCAWIIFNYVLQSLLLSSVISFVNCMSRDLSGGGDKFSARRLFVRATFACGSLKEKSTCEMKYRAGLK